MNCNIRLAHTYYDTNGYAMDFDFENLKELYHGEMFGDLPEIATQQLCIKSMMNDQKLKEKHEYFTFYDRMLHHSIDHTNDLFFASKKDLILLIDFLKDANINFRITLANKKIFYPLLSLQNASKEFKYLVYEHIYCKYNADDVLDKINSGLALTEIDYCILNKCIYTGD
jgi:hypothetical protein